jgi:tRNA-binding protein
VIENYRSEDLVGRQITAVVNFPPKQIGAFMSEVLVLGFPGATGGVVLIEPERAVSNGVRLY